MRRFYVLFLAGSVLTGCGNPFVGTWLFQFSKEPQREGSCAEDPDEVEYQGTQNRWVDILGGEGDNVVVFFDQALAGTVDGDSLDASWEGYTEQPTYREESSIDLSAALADDALSGKVTYSTAFTKGSIVVDCRLTYDLKAARLETDQDDYADLDN